MNNGTGLMCRILLLVFIVGLVVSTVFRISSAALPDNNNLHNRKYSGWKIG